MDSPEFTAAFAAVHRYSLFFLLLMLYSFLGWCGEMVYCSLGQRRLCEKRGFLNGPVCPVYGHGALLVLFALNGGCTSPAMTFLLGGILTSAIEYLTSYFMEKLFHMRWWDYSQKRYHLNGRVCLLNSTLFGLACVLLCHGVHPFLISYMYALLQDGAGVPLAFVLTVIYIIDIILSVRSAIQIGSRLEKLHAIHDELAEKLERLKAEQQQALEAQRERLEAVRAEAQQRLKALYEKPDFFERRLLQSFPAMRSSRHGEALAKMREYLESRKGFYKTRTTRRWNECQNVPMIAAPAARAAGSGPNRSHS